MRGCAAGARELAEFIRAHGDVPVPWAFVSAPGFPLGQWLAVQRAKGKADRLSRSCEQALDAVSATWRAELRELRWEEGLAALDRYIKDHGHPRPAAFYTDNSGFPLGRWVREQRKNYRHGTLPGGRLAALYERDFTWLVRDPDQTWTHHVELLTDYLADNGDTLVPPGHVTADGTHLGNWVRYVRGRRNKGTLTPERIAELSGIGFVWEAGPRGQKPGNQRRSDQQFARVLSELRAEADRCGTANLPYGYITHTGTRLGEWLARNRRFYREGTLHPDRVAALTALGVTLNPDKQLRRNHQLALSQERQPR